MTYKYTRKEIAKAFNYSPTSWEDCMFMLLEPAEWPQEGDKYWYVDVNGEVEDDDAGPCLIELGMKEFGNVFRTKKEAIKARNKIKKLLKEL